MRSPDAVRDHVLALARDAVGVEEPAAYDLYCDEDEIPWCAAFVRTLFEAADCPLPGNRWHIRAVWRMQRALEAAGARVRGGGALRPGDIVVSRREGAQCDLHMLRKRSPGHVGLYDRSRPETAEIVVIEGNVGDAVRPVIYALPSPDLLASYRWPLDLFDGQ